MTSAASVSSSAARLRRNAASAVLSVSINAARAAPRDSASIPSAPVPAKASSTFSSANGEPAAAKSPCDRMLNRASRARSLVGRTASPGGTSNLRPRCLPPTIRKRFGRMGFGRMRFHRPVAAPQLLLQHLFRHFLDRAAVEMAELEGAVGQADQSGHQVTEMLQHAANLAVLALAQ